jgi:hypothetical protein
MTFCLALNIPRKAAFLRSSSRHRSISALIADSSFDPPPVASHQARITPATKRTKATQTLRRADVGMGRHSEGRCGRETERGARARTHRGNSCW